MKEGLEKDTKKLDNSGVKDVETSSDSGKKKGKEERPPTKVVVRRLPPTMTEEEFLQQIDPLPPIDYMYYVPADNSLSPHSFCRAYLNFVNQSDIFIFTQKFDGYVFVDSKGIEYPAVVEFAPFQRIPKQRSGRKRDPKAGTIESDPLYTSFFEKLQVQMQENSSAGSNIKQHFFETNVTSNEENKVNTTPLLDYLRTRYAERLRIREEKRKKDLERKRARDEQRRNAKKAEEDSSILKVLTSQSNSKDKLKDKDSTKSTKKRSDDRIRDNKLKTGKSYAEERQRQAEKREEQKKRTNAASKTNKSQIDQTNSESINLEVENSNTINSNKSENDIKSSNDIKKESHSDKKNSQYKHSDFQKYKKDDDMKRRYKEGDRIKSKDQYRDRKEEWYNMKKKSNDKRLYDKYDDYNKHRKDHTNSRKDGSGVSKRPDLDVKDTKCAVESVVTKESSSSAKKKEIKNNILNQAETTIEENSGATAKLDSNIADSDTKINKENVNITVHKEMLNSLKSNTNVNLIQRRNSLESGGKGLSFYALNSNSDNRQYNSLAGLSPLLKSLVDYNTKIIENINIRGDNVKNYKLLCTSKSSDSNFTSENTDNQMTKDRGFEIYSKVLHEITLKRRNSVEIYDRKSEINNKHNRREYVRRSSLESGEQLKTSELLGNHKSERQKVEDNSETKSKDPRTERRIRNKDRPSMEIYRPGMGKFSKQRMEREKVLGSSTEVDSNSPSPSPTLVPKNKLIPLNQSEKLN